MTSNRASGCDAEQRGEGRQGQLQPVRLRLVAAEQQDGPPAGASGGRREARDVDRVREDLPRPARRADPLVGGALAELALVEDVVGREQSSPQRPVDGIGPLAGPARVPDPVLVDDEREPVGERSQSRARGRAAASSIPGTAA